MAEEENEIESIISKGEKILEETLFKRLADQMVENLPESSIISKEQQYERSFSELRKSFQSYKDGFNRAGKLLTEANFEVEGPKEGEVSEEGTIQQVMGLGINDLNRISDMAASYYEKKEYENARDLYLLLTTLRPNESDFWFGLGSTEQMSGHYESAVMAYTMAGDLYPDNPMIYLYSANCLRLLNRKTEAIAILDAIIEGLGAENVFIEVTDRAEELKKEWLNAA